MKPNFDNPDTKREAPDILPTPYSRSYWVEPGRFLAGCYPGSPYPDERADKLRGLLNAGIRTVINLMEPDEVSHGGQPFVPYQGELEEMGRARGVEIRVIRMPIRDLTVPRKDQMVVILNQLDQCLAAQSPVYLHCWGGRGRTGTVVGCYLARHRRAAGQEVIDLIANLRSNTSDYFRTSPDTPAQFQMVRGWKAGE